MKTINTFLFFLFAMLVANTAFTQWLAKPITPFDSANLFVRHLSVPKKDIIWVGSRSNVTNLFDYSPAALFARSLDGGNTWNSGRITLDATVTITSLFGVNADTAFATLSNWNTRVGKLYRTFDGGNTWNEVSNVFTAANCFAAWVAFTDPLNGVAFGDLSGAGEYQIYTTQDGGLNWAKISNAPVALSAEYGTMGYAIYGDTIYTGTQGSGRIFVSIDKGLTWTTKTSPYTGMIFMDISAKNGHELIAVMQYKIGTVVQQGYLKSVDGGDTWTWVLSLAVQSTRPASNASYIPGTYDTYLYGGSAMVNSNGTNISNDGGITWTQLDATTTFADNGNGAEWLSPDIGYAVSNYMGGVLGAYLLIWNGGTLADEQPLVYENTNAYPNPTQDIVSFRTHLLKQTSLEIQLTDVMGNVLESFADASAIGEYEHEFSLKKLPTGIYMIRALIGNQVVLKSVIKQ